MRKTKIVCTLGPASQSEKKIKELALAGMDLARINFSHGDTESRLALIQKVRQISRQLGKPIGILQDLQGPKLRVGELNKSKIHLKPGEIFILTSQPVIGDERRVFVSYPYLAEDIKAGDLIMLADGTIILQAEKVKTPEVFCKVLEGGFLKAHQGVNLPGVNLRISALTEKDKADLKTGVAAEVDWIALSFVRQGLDLLELKAELNRLGAETPVIAKLEKPQALDNLEEILNVADGIMIARGDLGVEVPIENLPHLQKELIKKSLAQGKPVITATQMLESMTRNLKPTRAEVTDVANAILDGTDAIMLSEETASGDYPVEAVKMMAKIAETTEQYLPYTQIIREEFSGGLLEIISLAACEIAESLKANAILTATSSGRSARMISIFKPRAPIIAASENPKTVQQLTLSWGIFPCPIPQVTTSEELTEELIKAGKNSGLLKDGDLALITAGFPPGVSGSTNSIKLTVLGEVFLRGFGVGEKQVLEGKIRRAKTPKAVLGSFQKGEILLVESLVEGYLKVLERTCGVITTSGGPGSKSEKLLLNHKIPGILGVAGAFKLFKDGDLVKLDIERGLVSKKTG